MSEEFDPSGVVDTEVCDGAVVRGDLRKSVAVTDLTDFSDFEARDDVTDSGVYDFRVEQRYLKEATRATKLTVGGSKDAYTTAQITVFTNRMRIRTFNLSAFTEVILPLVGEAVGVEAGGEVSFIFDHGVLTKIANSIVDSEISFHLVADKSYLEVSAGKTKLALSTKESVSFVGYHSRLGKGVHLSSLNPKALGDALEFSSLFVKKDVVQANFSLSDTRDGHVIGGSASSFGVYRSEALKGVNLKVRFETLAILSKVLPRFNESNTHLFEFGEYYVIRDEMLYFGWKKCSFAFPPIEAFFATPPKDFALIPRASFLNSLDRLAVVSVDKDLLVTLSVNGSGADSTLCLSTKDESGRVSGDALQVFRGASDDGVGSDFSPWSFSIHLGQLCRSLNHFGSANVRVELIQRNAGSAICLQDVGDGFHASTVLTALKVSD